MFYQRFYFVCLLFSGLIFSAPVMAREPISAVRAPESSFLFGGLVELLDDVYSADLNLAVEFAPCNCFSVYGDFAYRLVSYEYDVTFHDQRHEALNLDINGFNETYLGIKIAPYPFFGIDVNWRLPPGDGSQTNRFHRLGVEPMGLYSFSKTLQLGVSAGYFTFLEKNNFQPGDEMQLKGSMVWNVAWNMDERRGWEFSHVFLYRWRVQESENMNLKQEYRKMKDRESGFRMRTDVVRYFNLFKKALGLALFYEMNRGYLFGMETGHTVGMYSKLRW